MYNIYPRLELVELFPEMYGLVLDELNIWLNQYIELFSELTD